MSYRTFLIRLVTFLGGIYFFLRFVLPERITLGGTDYVFGRYNEAISNGFVLVTAVAVGLGLVNLLLAHGSRVVFRRKGWPFSLTLLGGLFAMLLVTGADWWHNEAISRQANTTLLLRAFSEAIVSDAENKKTGVRPFYERNEILRREVERHMRELQLRFPAEKALSAGGAPLENAPQSAEVKVGNSVKDLWQQIEQVHAILPLLETRETGGSPSFDANRNIARAISAVASSTRDIMRAEYQKSGWASWNDFLMQGFFNALGAAMFALLGFYIAAAAYRAFRVKSAESALLMITAVIVMLGQIPFGIWLWEGFPALRLWLLQVPNSGAARAIEIGAGVAGLIMAFRMWFSIEAESFK